MNGVFMPLRGLHQGSACEYPGGLGSSKNWSWNELLTEIFLFTMLRFACAYKEHVLQIASGFNGSSCNKVREPEFD